MREDEIDDFLEEVDDNQIYRVEVETHYKTGYVNFIAIIFVYD